MKILLSNLPPHADAESLRALVLKASKRHWLSYFGAPPELVQARVVRITDPATEATNYYGLLVVRPEKAAGKLIKQLRGKQLDGQEIEARQYHDRAPTDRRRVDGSSGHQPKDLSEKRRKDLVIETLLDESTQSIWEPREEE